ncbi:type II toxin-antitoxin system death-on-curing family toxin, partial [Klebsiella quasipneumoniae]
MIWVSAQEVIAFHDRILQRFPGVAGMSDPGRAEALIYRVQNRKHYEGITDVFELAATYWVAIARGHIFNDGNKRTAFFVTMTFL